MKVDLQRLSETAVKLAVTVEFSELEPAFNRAYDRIAKQINIPGFRKGKVPQRVIDQRVGRAAVLDEALNDAIPDAYENAVINEGLVPVGRPQIDVTEVVDESHVAFTVEVEVRPDFALPDLSELKIEVDTVVVESAAVDEQVDALRARFAKANEVDRECADGDLLLVDLSGTLDGELVDDLQASALSYELGTDGMLPGFDAAVRGAKAGETRNFTFTPEGGPDGGKTFDISVTVKAVRERELPTLDDAFAQLASEFDTVAELRGDLEARLAKMKRLEQAYQARDKVQQTLLDAVDFPLPEGVLAAEIAAHFEDGHGDEAHREEFAANSRNSMKAQFIFDKIAEAESLSVTEQELSAWLVQQAPRYGMQPQEFADALVQSGGVQMAVADVRRAKAVEVALRAAQIVDSAGVIVDLAALDEELAR